MFSVGYFESTEIYKEKHLSEPYFQYPKISMINILVYFLPDG